MVEVGLRKKILGGYILISILIISIGAISINQFNVLSNLVGHLTERVAKRVRIVNAIGYEILEMRTSVEKYLYKKMDIDKMDAENHIKNLQNLLHSESENIKNQDWEIYFKDIEKLTNEYIEKFTNVSVRVKAIENNVNKIKIKGGEIEKEFNELISRNRDNYDKLQLMINSLVAFVAAEKNVYQFFEDYDTAHSEKTINNLEELVRNFEKLEEEGAEKQIVMMQDYLDDFIGATSISLKMNEEIEKTLLPLAPLIVKISNEINESGWSEMAGANEDVTLGVRNTGRLILGFIIASVFLGLIIGLVLSKFIIKPILLVVKGLSDSADRVALSSKQISSSSLKVATGASEQASLIEETSASLTEIAAMTRENNKDAFRVKNLMSEANTVVGNANAVMTALNDSMRKIANTNEQTASIIKTIDAIAFQTNLLALNAAVEAARAGETGAGFAVVADEVRNLAMRAATAASSTTNLIQESMQRVGEGQSLMRETNAAFIKVSEKTTEVYDLVEKIAKASNEQTAGIEQINKAVSEMDIVIQNNVANSEESAATANELIGVAKLSYGFVNELWNLIGRTSRSASGAGAKDEAKRRPAPLTSLPLAGVREIGRNHQQCRKK